MRIEHWQETCKSFLPDGWHLGVSRKKLYADWVRECIFVPSDFDYTDDNFLRLMHEVGHANLDKLRSEEELEYECWLRDKASMGFEELTDLEREAYKRIVINEEVMAWGFVLSNLGVFKEKGLVSQVVELDMVVDLMDKKLESYWKMIDS